MTYHEKVLKPSSSSSTYVTETMSQRGYENQNHDLEKIKVVVNYSENNGVQKRTSRLVENFNYVRSEDGIELRKTVSSNKSFEEASSTLSPPRIKRSPSSSPHFKTVKEQIYTRPISPVILLHKEKQLFSSKYICKRSRSRSLTPPSKHLIYDFLNENFFY